MHKTLVLVIFPLHSSVFHYRTKYLVKFDDVLHHDIRKNPKRIENGNGKVEQISFQLSLDTCCVAIARISCDLLTGYMARIFVA